MWRLVLSSAILISLSLPAHAKDLPRCITYKPILDAARTTAHKKLFWGTTVGHESTESEIVAHEMSYDDYQIAELQHMHLRYLYIDQQARAGSCK